MPELDLLIIAWKTIMAASLFPVELRELGEIGREVGAFGLLIAVFMWYGRVTNRVVDRALKAFDKMGDTMESIRVTLVSFENRLERVEEKLEECDKIRQKVE